MDKEFVKRLRLLMEHYGFTYNELGNVLGVTEDTAGNYLTGRTQMKLPKAREMAKHYGFDPNWLLTGKGTNPIAESLHTDQVADAPAEYRKAKAGLLSTRNQSVVIRGLLSSALGPLPIGNYAVFEVDGMSMHPSLCQGDKLLCRQVSVDDMVDSRIHVIVANRPDLNEVRSDGVWVKRCFHRKENGYVTCKSDNRDSSEPFVTFRLKTSEVLEVWYPVLRITGHMADPNRDVYEQLDELRERIEILEQISDV